MNEPGENVNDILAGEAPAKRLRPTNKKHAHPCEQTVRGNLFAVKPLHRQATGKTLVRLPGGIFPPDVNGRHQRTGNEPLGQAEFAARTAGCGRKVHNLALGEMNAALAAKIKVPSYADLCLLLTDWKDSFPYLHEAPHHPLQQVLKELREAYAQFLKGTKGRPRFKRKGDDITIRFPDPSQFTYDAKKGILTLPKLGILRLFNARPLDGEIICCSLTVAATGKISVSLPTRTAVPRTRAAAPCGTREGLDFGLAGATGQMIDTRGTRHGPSERQEKKIVRKAKFIGAEQRRRSKMTKGSRNSLKSKRKIARAHAAIANVRHDATHKATAGIARTVAFLGVEDASSRDLAEMNAAEGKHGLAAKLMASLWYPAKIQLDYKLAEAGGTTRRVAAPYTSCTCIEPDCTNHLRSNTQWRSGRFFTCPACGTREDSEVHAAKTILLLALHPDITLGAVPSRGRHAPTRPERSESPSGNPIVTGRDRIVTAGGRDEANPAREDEGQESPSFRAGRRSMCNHST